MPKSALPTTDLVQRQIDNLEITLPPSMVEIIDNEEYEEAATALKAIKRQQKALEDLRKTVTRPLDEAKENLMDLFRPQLNKLAAREKGIRNAMGAYTQELERKRRALEAKLRDEQRAEQRRIEAKAEALRQKGKEEQAEAMLETVPATPIVVADTPKVSGVISRTTWKGELTDIGALLQYVLENEAYDLVSVNQSELNSLARTVKLSREIPGVRIFEDTGVAVRA